MTQYEKIESLKKIFCKICLITIKKYLTANFIILKSQCEELVQTLSVRYNKQIDHLQNELKTKDKIIDQLVKSLISLTNSELE